MQRTYGVNHTTPRFTVLELKVNWHSSRSSNYCIEENFCCFWRDKIWPVYFHKNRWPSSLKGQLYNKLIVLLKTSAAEKDIHHKHITTTELNQPFISLSPLQTTDLFEMIEKMQVRWDFDLFWLPNFSKPGCVDTNQWIHLYEMIVLPCPSAGLSSLCSGLKARRPGGGRWSCLWMVDHCHNNTLLITQPCC